MKVNMKCIIQQCTAISVTIKLIEAVNIINLKFNSYIKMLNIIFNNIFLYIFYKVVSRTSKEVGMNSNRYSAIFQSCSFAI